MPEQTSRADRTRLQLATVCRIGEDKIVAIETYLSDVDGMNKFFADRP